jgi:hypothetical protein
MKKMFTKLFGTALLTGLLMTGIAAKAQTLASTGASDTKDAAKISSVTDQPAKAADPVDTSFHPVRRLWGYTFGDFYYAAQAPSLITPPSPAVVSTQGKETNYSGVPGGRNAFQFRRIYLGYDYDIDRRFSVQLVLASEPAANTTATTTTTSGVTTSINNGDNLADNKMSFYIKYINLRWKSIYSGADLVLGSQATPGWANFSEAIWGYRSIEKTVADFHGSNSYDIGAAIQGTFDPTTKNYGYDVMIGDNTQAKLLPASSAANGFFKAVYGDLWLKALNKTLTVQLYGDYMQTASTSTTQPGLGPQDHSMLKAFVAYSIPSFTIGVEGFTNTFKNALTIATPASTPLVNQNARAEAISIFAHAPITKKLNVFARYDSYNPDNENFNGADVYNVNTNFSSYDPFTKEEFFTGGLDFNPAKNIHFMPNIWYIKYKDQRDPTTAKYEVPSQTLVYRLTFFFQFGK